MSLYYFNISAIQRSQGQSAIGHAAYINCAKYQDERLGIVRNELRHKKKDKVIDLGSRLPDGSTIDTETLWNMAEKRENRKDAITGRSIIVALQAELSTDENIACMERLRSHMMKKYGIAMTAAVHLDIDHNPHGHFQGTRRVFKNGKLTDTIEVLDKKTKSSAEVDEIRHVWQDIVNEALTAKGLDPISCERNDEKFEAALKGKHLGAARFRAKLREMGVTPAEYSKTVMDALAEMPVTNEYPKMEEAHDQTIGASGTTGIVPTEDKPENSTSGRRLADIERQYQHSEKSSPDTGRTADRIPENSHQSSSANPARTGKSGMSAEQRGITHNHRNIGKIELPRRNDREFAERNKRIAQSAQNISQMIDFARFERTKQEYDRKLWNRGIEFMGNLTARLLNELKYQQELQDYEYSHTHNKRGWNQPDEIDNAATDSADSYSDCADISPEPEYTGPEGPK